MRKAALAVAVALTSGVVYRLIVSGEITLDVGSGRRTLPLGPLTRTINAPRDTVFDVVAAPYLGRTPRALAGEIEILERGSDMVLAAHHTAVGRKLSATTVETVRFERPARVTFRLVRGPVPHVTETFTLTETGGRTSFLYEGELGTDFADACPIATVALEVASTNETLREVTAHIFNAWIDSAADRLERSGIERAAARDLAMVLVAALEGGFVLSRAFKDTAPMHAIGEALVHLLEMSTPLQ